MHAYRYMCNHTRVAGEREGERESQEGKRKRVHTELVWPTTPPNPSPPTNQQPLHPLAPPLPPPLPPSNFPGGFYGQPSFTGLMSQLR